ncbi:alpha-amylase family glycosyl hydrolase [Mycolicibacterium hodleri]|uniref:alpha-amylase family glycosyl hydrolase n=1 Tax=Mycolicibacterium hodleri TaxID=49897 RepID=UPI003FD77B5C
MVLYYGDELGMTDSDIPDHLHRDPLTAGRLSGQWPRDNARAPMRWDASPAGGFTAGEPWLPVHPVHEHNVADQTVDPTSMLALVRSLISLRRRNLSDPASTYRAVHVDAHRRVFDSGPLRVSGNFTDYDVPFEAGGESLLSSLGPTPGASDSLRAWEAVVSRRDGDAV